MARNGHVQWDRDESDDEDEEGTGTVVSRFSSLVRGVAPAQYALGGMAHVKRFWMRLPGRRTSGRVLCGNICLPAEEAYELKEEEHLNEEEHPVFAAQGNSQDDFGTCSQEHQSAEHMCETPCPSPLTRCFSTLRTLTFRRRNLEGVSFMSQDSLSRSCSETDHADTADEPSSKVASHVLLALLIGLLVYLFIII